MAFDRVRLNATVQHQVQCQDPLPVVSGHNLSLWLKGECEPNDLLASRVDILLDKIDLLIWPSLHQEPEHFLGCE